MAKAVCVTPSRFIAVSIPTTGTDTADKDYEGGGDSKGTYFTPLWGVEQD